MSIILKSEAKFEQKMREYGFENSICFVNGTKQTFFMISSTKFLRDWYICHHNERCHNFLLCTNNNRIIIRLYCCVEGAFTIYEAMINIVGLQSRRIKFILSFENNTLQTLIDTWLIPTNAGKHSKLFIDRICHDLTRKSAYLLMMSIPRDVSVLCIVH